MIPMNQKCSARMRTSAEMQLKLHEVNRYAIPLGRGESAMLILCSASAQLYHKEMEENYVQQS